MTTNRKSTRPSMGPPAALLLFLLLAVPLAAHLADSDGLASVEPDAGVRAQSTVVEREPVLELEAAIQPDKAVQPDTTIIIRSTGSNLEFSPSRISVKEGTEVTIRYINEGTLPHNFVLVKSEDDIDMLGMAAMQASETGYVPMEHADRMFAYSPLAAPGETVETSFVVPAPGEYFFVCLYPGHYNMMIGTLRSLN